MFFCENDGNMLRKKIKDDKKLIYYCQTCEAEYDVDEVNKNKNKSQNNCIFKQNYNNNNLSYLLNILDGTYNDIR